MKSQQVVYNNVAVVVLVVVAVILIIKFVNLSVVTNKPADNSEEGVYGSCISSCHHLSTRFPPLIDQ